jgi:hypothetical protein
VSNEAPHEVAGEVAETVAPDSVETPNPPSGPSNADIMGRLDTIESLLTNALDTTSEHAVTPETPGNDGDVEEPGNGEVIRDKSPASKPWTHKRILK